MGQPDEKECSHNGAKNKNDDEGDVPAVHGCEWEATRRQRGLLSVLNAGSDGIAALREMRPEVEAVTVVFAFLVVT
jgi:hypothetical protein